MNRLFLSDAIRHVATLPRGLHSSAYTFYMNQGFRPAFRGVEISSIMSDLLKPIMRKHVNEHAMTQPGYSGPETVAERLNTAFTEARQAAIELVKGKLAAVAASQQPPAASSSSLPPPLDDDAEMEWAVAPTAANIATATKKKQTTLFGASALTSGADHCDSDRVRTCERARSLAMTCAMRTRSCGWPSAKAWSRAPMRLARPPSSNMAHSCPRLAALLHICHTPPAW